MQQQIPGIPLGRTLVMGGGPSNAEIVIVGDAPGAQEEKYRQPFVGPAGSLLNESLHRAGIPRTSVYATNIIKERPPRNDIGKFIKFSRSGAVETPEFIAYKDFLRTEILAVGPNVVVAAGAVSLWALCDIQGIQKYRGSILESTLIPGMKVIPILHPTSALRNYIWRHFISYDLARVKEQKGFAWFDFKEREYVLEPSYDDCILFLNDCDKREVVAFDIETYGREVSCISFAPSDDLAISIPFVLSGGREYFSMQQEMEIWRRIARLLENPKIAALGQNTTFDASFLFRKYGIRTSNVQDTMVASNILFPDFPRNLGFLTSIYTDLPYYKDDGRDAIHGRAGVSIDFWRYNARDSIVLMEVFPKQIVELNRQGNLEAYKNQVALIPLLTHMTELGIRVDVEALRNKSGSSQDDLNRLQKELDEEVGYPLNANSPKQVAEYFYGDLGIKPYKKNGRPTTDEGALKRIARRGYKAAEILLQMRRIGKMDGTYFSMKLDDDGRLRSSMNPGRTSSGRLSSSKTIFGTGANMQNQPPEMKRYLLPDEGYVVYNMDLAQAENRIVAYIGPDLTMINAFETGVDLHSLTASFITPAFGETMTPQEVKEAHNAGEKCFVGSGQFSWRFWGKKANHAFNYGQGYKAFSYQVEIPEPEGKLIYDRYHSAYPGVHRMHEWIQASLRKNRTIENLFGRKRLYLDRWGETLFLEAYSFIPQSSIADKINRQGLLYIWNDPYFSGVQILNQVHDSIVFQIPVSAGWGYHSGVLSRLKESLEQPVVFRGREFSIPVDIEISRKNMKETEEVRGTTAVAIQTAYEKLNG